MCMCSLLITCEYTQCSTHSPTPSDIPESARPDLLEALSLWRKAETRRESDVMVAIMSYSRAASEPDPHPDPCTAHVHSTTLCLCCAV